VTKGSNQYRANLIGLSPSWQSIRRHSVFRDPDRLNEAVLIEAQHVDAHHSVVSVGLTERTAMVHDVPIARGW
jgi:hypothetical protein